MSSSRSSSGRFVPDEGASGTFGKRDDDTIDLLGFQKRGDGDGERDYDDLAFHSTTGRSCLYRYRALIAVLAILAVSGLVSLGIALGMSTSSSKASPSSTPPPLSPTTPPASSCAAVPYNSRVDCAPGGTSSRERLVTVLHASARVTSSRCSLVTVL